MWCSRNVLAGQEAYDGHRETPVLLDAVATPLGAAVQGEVPAPLPHSPGLVGTSVVIGICMGMGFLCRRY